MSLFMCMECGCVEKTLFGHMGVEIGDYIIRYKNYDVDILKSSQDTLIVRLIFVKDGPK